VVPVRLRLLKGSSQVGHHSSRHHIGALPLTVALQGQLLHACSNSTATERLWWLFASCYQQQLPRE
jgi:hypothetical protein